MTVHLLGYPMVLCLGMLAGSWLGIRGYRRRQVARLLQAVRESAYTPRTATIPLVVDASDHWLVLSPLTGQEIVQPGTPCS